MTEKLAPAAKNLLVFALTAAVAVVLDQGAKALVAWRMDPGSTAEVIPHVVSLTYSTNTGGAFGLLRGSGQIVFLAALTIVVLALAWVFWSRGRGSVLSFVGLGLIIGGALGNLLDRVFRGRVLDFIDLGWWPVFNVADIAIVGGVIITLLVYGRELLRPETDGS